MKTLTFTITDEAYDLLLSIKGGGLLEYRDSEFRTLQDFLNSTTFNIDNKTEKWFMKRNQNGTYYLIEELVDKGLVDCDNEAWHLSFGITSFGRDIVSDSSIRNNKIEEILK